MKRAVDIEFNNGQEPKELELGKAASVRTPKEFIHLDKMPDGKWSLVFSESLVSDFSTIKSLNIVRED